VPAHNCMSTPHARLTHRWRAPRSTAGTFDRLVTVSRSASKRPPPPSPSPPRPFTFVLEAPCMVRDWEGRSPEVLWTRHGVVARARTEACSCTGISWGVGCTVQGVRSNSAAPGFGYCRCRACRAGLVSKIFSRVLLEERTPVHSSIAWALRLLACAHSTAGAAAPLLRPRRFHHSPHVAVPPPS